jgi:threonine/homoserine/homoserine lactone efflux protein
MPLLAFAWLAAYAALAGRLRAALTGRRVARGVNGGTGATFVALAAKLAGAGPA